MRKPKGKVCLVVRLRERKMRHHSRCTRDYIRWEEKSGSICGFEL